MCGKIPEKCLCFEFSGPDPKIMSCIKCSFFLSNDKHASKSPADIWIIVSPWLQKTRRVTLVQQFYDDTIANYYLVEEIYRFDSLSEGWKTRQCPQAVETSYYINFSSRFRVGNCKTMVRLSVVVWNESVRLLSSGRAVMLLSKLYSWDENFISVFCKF